MTNGATRGDDKVVDCAKAHAAWSAIGAAARRALSDELGGNGTVNRIRGYATLKSPPRFATQKANDRNIEIFARHCGVDVETLLAVPAAELDEFEKIPAPKVDMSDTGGADPTEGHPDAKSNRKSSNGAGPDPADEYLRSCRRRLAEGLRTSMPLTTFICQVVACPAAADPQARAVAVADRLVADPRAGLSALRKAWNHFQGHGVESGAEALSALRAPIRVLVPLIFGRAEVAQMKGAMAGGGLALSMEVYFPVFVEGAMARREGRPGQWVSADDDYAWGFTALDRPAEGGDRAFQNLPERVVTELFRLFVKRSGQGKTYEQKIEILKDRMKLYNETPAGKYYYITNEIVDERDRGNFDSVIENLQRELPHVVFISCVGGDARRKLEDDLIWGLAEYLYDE